VKDELRTLYQQLVTYRPKTAQAVKACYIVQGKAAAAAVLETLRTFIGEGQQRAKGEPNRTEPEANRKGVLQRLRGG
jgi:hypothetical protein